MKHARRMLAAAVATSALSIGGIAFTAAPSGAQPLVTGGLVNVTVTNLLNNNQVALQIPVNAAANVCGIAVNVLSSQLTSGPVTCTSRSGNQSLDITKL